MSSYDWERVFRETPETLGELLRVMFVDHPPEGGDDLFGRLHPQVSFEPFELALGELVRQYGVATMGRGLDPERFERLRMGEAAATVEEMKILAVNGEVSVGYFREYRERVIAQGVVARLRKFPGVGVSVFKILEKERNGGG